MHIFRRFALSLAAVCLFSSISPAGAQDGAALRGFVRGEGYQYVTFGAFPQTVEGSVEPLLWRVLSVQDGQAYLLSEHVLEAHQMHHAWECYGDWLETDLYAYLNGAFLAEAFTQEERAALVESIAPGTVFLPSYEDVKNPEFGFTDPKSRQSAATPYGVAGGLYTYNTITWYSPYWTRTREPKAQPGSTRRTMLGGVIGYIRAIVADLGYRPGALLTLDAVSCMEGEGTRQAPYRLIPRGAGDAPILRSSPPKADSAAVQSTPAPTPTYEPASISTPTSTPLPDDVAQDLTLQAQIDASVNAGKLHLGLDRSYSTAWRVPRGQSQAWVQVTTSDSPIGGLYIAWAEQPKPWRLETLHDGTWQTVGHGGLAGYVHEYLPVPKGSTAVRLVSDQPGNAFDIAELFVFGEGATPDFVQRWQPTAEKADLMLLCAHPDDEFIYMGGTIPTYAGERQKAVLVVTLACANATRRSELLNALWTGGLRQYPLMGDFPDKAFRSLEDAYAGWNPQEVRAFILEVLRKYKPEVVVTHDRYGEYGHGAHRLCADVAQYAFHAAANPAKQPASAEAYGAWQVKKLYLHLGKDDPMIMDWHVPLAAFGGHTALEVATEAYQQHVSQVNTSAFQVREDYLYSCAEFGLLLSTVGPDAAKNDFLEHILP